MVYWQQDTREVNLAGVLEPQLAAARADEIQNPVPHLPTRLLLYVLHAAMPVHGPILIILPI